MTREQLFNRKIEKISTPDGDVFVRSLTAGDMVEYFDKSSSGYLAMAVAAKLALCTEDGSPLFVPGDDPKEITLNAKTLSVIAKKVADMNGLSVQEADDAKKN